MGLISFISKIHCYSILWFTTLYFISHHRHCIFFLNNKFVTILHEAPTAFCQQHLILSFLCHNSVIFTIFSMLSLLLWFWKVKMKVLVSQSCLTLWNCMDCSLPGCSIRGILQARLLEWFAILFSKDLPNSGIEPRPLEMQADSLPSEPQGIYNQQSWCYCCDYLGTQLIAPIYILCMFWLFHSLAISPFSFLSSSLPIPWDKTMFRLGQ